MNPRGGFFLFGAEALQRVNLAVSALSSSGTFVRLWAEAAISSMPAVTSSTDAETSSAAAAFLCEIRAMDSPEF